MQIAYILTGYAIIGARCASANVRGQGTMMSTIVFPASEYGCINCSIHYNCFFAWANKNCRLFCIQRTAWNIKGQFCMSDVSNTEECCMTDRKVRPVKKLLFQGLRAP